MPPKMASPEMYILASFMLNSLSSYWKRGRKAKETRSWYKKQFFVHALRYTILLQHQWKRSTTPKQMKLLCIDYFPSPQACLITGKHPSRQSGEVLLINFWRSPFIDFSLLININLAQKWHSFSRCWEINCVALQVDPKKIPSAERWQLLFQILQRKHKIWLHTM